MQALPLLLLLAVAPQAARGEPPPDVLVLRGGKEVEGVILRVGSKKLYLGQDTRVRTVDLTDLDSMRGPRVAFKDYPARLRQAFRGRPESARECLERASWCSQNGLTRDVDLHLWQALLVDPSNEEAHEALGHQRVRGVWRIRVPNHGLADWRELQEIRMDFQDPWEFTTAHYEVRAAGALQDVLAACSALEILYAAFFETFQDGVGFFEVREPIKVQLYPDYDAYPSLTNTQRGYFDPVSRVIYTYFQDGVAQHLMHEGTHALLHYTARETGRQEPRIPGWVDEGMATYMESCMTGSPGAPRFEPGLKNQGLFEAHARAEDPDSLTRVLNYQTSDYRASTRQEQKYAQSYTLLYFLLHHRDLRYWEGFWRFMKSVYERKGSMSHFQNAMELRSLKLLEREWRAWVKTP